MPFLGLIQLGVFMIDDNLYDDRDSLISNLLGLIVLNVYIKTINETSFYCILYFF